MERETKKAEEVVKKMKRGTRQSIHPSTHAGTKNEKYEITFLLQEILRKNLEGRGINQV